MYKLIAYTLACLAIGGYLFNIFKLIIYSGEATGLLIIRGIGIIIPWLGAVVGWF